MLASPRGLSDLDADMEKQRLEQAIAHLRQAGLVELEWIEGGTWRDLARAVRPNQGPWHIFHFMGHGGFDQMRKEGFLALSDREGDIHVLTATELGRVLADQGARCVWWSSTPVLARKRASRTSSPAPLGL